jgi:hypothetical protein
MRRYGLLPAQPIIPPAEPVKTADEPVIDLDFSGGPPAELVEEIKVQLGDTSLNVIIPDHLAGVNLPSLRLERVTVSALFEAITEATRRTLRMADPNSRAYPPGSVPPVEYHVASGFRRIGTEGSPVWVFYSEGPPIHQQAQNVCRFFQLGPYLEDYTIEDITTAIRTGYDLLGGAPPEMKFHHETRLLIAVGPEDQLRLIDSALQQLQPGTSLPPGSPAGGTAAKPVRRLPMPVPRE